MFLEVLGATLLVLLLMLWKVLLIQFTSNFTSMKRGCNIHHSSLRSYFFIYMLNLGIKKQEDGGRNGLPCVFVLHMHRQLCAENKERKRDRGRGIDFLFDSILYHSLSERRSMTPRQINDWCISFFLARHHSNTPISTTPAPKWYDGICAYQWTDLKSNTSSHHLPSQLRWIQCCNFGSKLRTKEIKTAHY